MQKAKRFILLLIFITNALIFSVIQAAPVSCVQSDTAANGTPQSTTKTLFIKVANFSAIDSEGPFDIFINGKASSQTIRVTGDAVVLTQCVTIESRNQVLYLSASQAPVNQRIRVEINVPYLTDLKLAGSTRLTGNNIKGHDWFRIYTADNSSAKISGEVKLAQVVQNGTGTINIYWTGSDDLRIYTLGAGAINLAGTTNYLYAYLNNDSKLDAKYLRAQQVWVRTTGNAFAKVMPLNTLRGFALNNSNIYYYNKPINLTQMSQDSASVLLVPAAVIPSKSSLK